MTFKKGENWMITGNELTKLDAVRVRVARARLYAAQTMLEVSLASDAAWLLEQIDQILGSVSD